MKWIILFMLSCPNAFAGGLSGPTNEEIAAEFHTLGSQIIEGIKLVGPEVFPQIDFEKLKSGFEKTQITVIKDSRHFLSARVASNFPEKNLIQIRRRHWLHAIERLPLVLHEYLGISGQEASETYSLSVEIIRLMRKRLFDRQLLKIEGIPKFEKCSTTYLKLAVAKHIEIHHLKMSVAIVAGVLVTYPLTYGTFFFAPSLLGVSSDAAANAVIYESFASLGLFAHLGSRLQQPKRKPTSPGTNHFAKIFHFLNFQPDLESISALSGFKENALQTYRSRTGDERTSDGELNSRIEQILHYGDESGELCPPRAPLNFKQIKSYVIDKMSPADRNE